MTPEQLGALPLQVLLLIALAALWRAYTASNNGRIDDLKQNYEKGLADLRTRVMLLEDHAGMRVQTAPNSSAKAVPSAFGGKDSKLD